MEQNQCKKEGNTRPIKLKTEVHSSTIHVQSEV